MNIGIVCYPTFGGSGVLATELGKALADKGHVVHFITYQQPVRLTGFSANIFFHEVRVPAYPLFDFPPYETALASTLVDVVKNNNIDLLHVHYAIPHASSAYMAKQILKTEGISIPVVTTLHGTDITLVGKDPSYEPVVTFSINQSDGVTAVSEDLKKETYDYFDIKRDIEVIPNFIDLERFKKQRKEHFKLAICPNGEKLLVHTSNFRKVKRVEDVVRIFNIIQQKVPAKLLLIGDGPERSNIEKVCRELHVCDKVTYLGKQEAIEEILSICDLFILPSESESFGLAALEAMAASAVVISSNAGGLAEVNIDEKTGYTAAVGDTKTMSEKAIELLKDEVKLKQFKANAKAQAALFDIHHIIPQYEALYRQYCRTGDC